MPQHRISEIAGTQGRGATLADDEKSPGSAIGSAIQAAKAAAAKSDRADLNKTLVKSSEWKKNTLAASESGQSTNQADEMPAFMDALKLSLLELLERHWQELITNADPSAYEQLRRNQDDPAAEKDSASSLDSEMQKELEGLRKTATLYSEEIASVKRLLHKKSEKLETRSEEIKRLRQMIAQLKADNARLAAEHKDELEAHRAEMLELQAAYDQFEQQSDLILIELEQQNEQLQVESRHQKRWSMH